MFYICDGLIADKQNRSDRSISTDAEGFYNLKVLKIIQGSNRNKRNITNTFCKILCANGRINNTQLRVQAIIGIQQSEMIGIGVEITDKRNIHEIVK
ncbi:hypothetical protein SDC9_53617 [bioreactor metagenome]|uniref:Uncharacterized protein n=1 Tax=bioreactor metagenome TaxID=1076179 RepID=A0A644WUP1_9ZZZZ